MVGLLIALVALSGATEAFDCVQHFYKLHTRHENQRSDCPLLMELTGVQWNRDSCFAHACRFGANVVNLRVTHDELSDNVCDLRTCSSEDLMLVNTTSGQGYAVYPNALGGRLRCSSNKRLLSCWTCDNAPNEERCVNDGHHRACFAPHPVCTSTTVRDASGVIRSVSRGCGSLEACHAETWSLTGTCDQSAEGPLLSSCEHCTFRPDQHQARCYDIKPDLDRGRNAECRNGWLLLHNPQEGYKSCCRHLATHINYTVQGCHELACLLKGNVVSFNYPGRCQVQHCDASSGDGVQIEESEYGSYVYVSSMDHSCAAADKKLFCKSCVAASSLAECAESDDMVQCDNDDDTCLFEKIVSTTGEIQSVSMGCSPRDQCQSWDPSRMKCTGNGNGPGKKCSYCKSWMGENLQLCHKEFDDACLASFSEVEQDTGSEPTTQCLRMNRILHQWVDSCKQIACDYGANMFLFEQHHCELYLCEATDNLIVRMGEAEGKTIYHRGP